MYSKPDFVKVDLEIRDNFAAYNSCPYDESGENAWTMTAYGNCKEYEHGQNLIEAYPSASWQCYSSYNP
ncbi:MAG: hypothetical protein IJV39_00550 [Ruminococcus sp.]|nr:hypothetical protein [Ruminococcus sp.]